MVFEQRRRSLESCLSKILAATDKIMKPCLLSNTAIGIDAIIVINNIFVTILQNKHRHHDIIIRRSTEGSSSRGSRAATGPVRYWDKHFSMNRCHVSAENGDSVPKVDKTVPAGEETATVSLHNVRNSIEEAYDDRR